MTPPVAAPAPPRNRIRGGIAPVPAPPPAPPEARSGPVRLAPAEVASPFAPGREVAFARVSGSWLAAAGVRDGDHVALARRDAAEHGDLAAVIGPDGKSALWKVYPCSSPEGSGGWRLSTGDRRHSRFSSAPPRVCGVVVGVLRRFP